MEEMDSRELEYVELIKKLDNSELEAILTPVERHLYRRTTGSFDFAISLKTQGVITPQEFEVFDSKPTPSQKHYFLYDIIVKKAVGKELIEALKDSGNWHIIKILVKSYREVIGKKYEDAGRINAGQSSDTTNGQSLLLDATASELPKSSTSALRETVDGDTSSSDTVTRGQESIVDITMTSVADPSTGSKSIPEVPDPEVQNQIDATEVTSQKPLITSSNSALQITMDPKELKYVELIKELKNSDLKAIIMPVLPEVCEQTTDEVNFALKLVALKVMTYNQFEQFELAGTTSKKNFYLYNNIMKKTAGTGLIEALRKSGNEHIIKILVESYRKVIAKDYEDKGCTNAGYSSDTTSGQSSPFDATSPDLPPPSTSTLRESVDGGNSSVTVIGGQKSIVGNTRTSVADPATGSETSLLSDVTSQEPPGSSTSSVSEMTDGGTSSYTVNLGQEIVTENTMTLNSGPASGSKSIPEVQDSETMTIKLRWNECIKDIYGQLSSPYLCPRTLTDLEFVHFTATNNSLKPMQFSGMCQPLNFPELVSLTIKIDQEDDSVHEKPDIKKCLPPKKILQSLLSVFEWHGVKRNALLGWFGVKKNRLNKLWEFPQINVVDIRIGNKTIIYFNKQDGQLTVHWMSFFDPNKYLKKAGADLKKFSCAKNYEPLCMSSIISFNNLTELNLRNCKFDFNPKNDLNLNNFLPKYTNLSKLIMSASEYKDFNSNIFNLDYIASASTLKIITLGNFIVTVTEETGDSSAQKFTKIWNSFKGQTLTFCDCNLIGLKLDAMEELGARAKNNADWREKDKIIVQLQKSEESDGQERENHVSIGKDSASWHLLRSPSSDSNNTDNGWSVISYPTKTNIDLQQTYDKICYKLFEIKDFSSEPCKM